jgi:hypothetical protein
MQMDKAKLVLNQSAVVMFMMCPEKARRVFLEHEFCPIGLPAHRGTAVHHAAKENFTQKIRSHTDLPVKDVVDISINALRENIDREGVYLTDEEKSIGLKKLVNKTEHVVKNMAQLYAEQIAPDYQPKEVEQTHEFDLPNGAAIKGTIDMVTQDERIFDLKTVTKAKDTFSKSLQFIIYPLLYWLRHGTNPAGIVIEQIVDGTIPTRKQETIEANEDDYAAALEQVHEVTKMVQAEIFPGAYGNPSAWWCSKKYCAFWHTCRYVPKRFR